MEAAARAPDFASHRLDYKNRKAWHCDAGSATLQGQSLVSSVPRLGYEEQLG